MDTCGNEIVFKYKIILLCNVANSHIYNTTSLFPLYGILFPPLVLWYTVQVELTCLLNPQEFPHHYTQHIKAGKYNIAKYGSLPIMLRLTLTKEALM